MSGAFGEGLAFVETFDEQQVGELFHHLQPVRDPPPHNQKSFQTASIFDFSSPVIIHALFRIRGLLAL